MPARNYYRRSKYRRDNDYDDDYYDDPRYDDSYDEYDTQNHHDRFDRQYNSDYYENANRKSYLEHSERPIQYYDNYDDYDSYNENNYSNENPSPSDLKALGFNWGAAAIPHFWLLLHRKPGWGLLFIFFWVLYQGIMIFDLPYLLYLGIWFLWIIPRIAFGIYLGLNGNQIAWESGKFKTIEDLDRSTRNWNGFGFGIIMLVGLVFLCGFIGFFLDMLY